MFRPGRRVSLQVSMGMEPGTSDGKIKVDEHYPHDTDEPPPFDIKRIENIRSNVKFETCYEISKHIGDGKFGKVFQVKEKSTGQEFAAKFIRIRKEADRTEVEREVSILTSLRHPRIAQIYDAFYTTTNDVVLIMEIVRGGELFDRVADENYVLTEMAVVMIICQLCEAIEYIHQQNILHLDIKPENIMCVSQTGNRIKLIDFGLARHYDGNQELKYMAGTPEFAAPEVIKFEKLDYHTDMWSVGVITYILLSGYSPFLGDNLGETYCNVERGVWEFTEEFDTVSEEAKDFVSHLLVYDQRKRMLPAACLEHPWIAKHRAKARCDRQLERPQDGPKIDNKMHMRYNAKRKFRRMVIYVKFLIEMNRLRNSLRERMSENGQKFFDPLLRMAEAKEKKIDFIIHGDKKQKLEIPKIVEELDETKKQDVEEKKKKKRTYIKPAEATELMVPSKNDQTSDSEGSIKSAKSDTSEKKKKLKSDESPKKLVKKETIDIGDAVTVVVKKPKLKKEASKATDGEKSDVEKTPRKKSLALSDSETPRRKKSDASLNTPAITLEKVKKVSAPTLMIPEITKKSSSSSDLMNDVFKMPALKLKESKSVESKLNLAVDEPKRLLEKKKTSTPEVVLNPPPRKTTLAPSKSLDHTKANENPVRNVTEKKTVEKTERSDSTKENQSADEKKPVRTGALKKKKSENGDIIKKKKSIDLVETTKTTQSVDGNKEVTSLETNTVKRKSITSNPEEGQKSVVTVAETKKLSSPRGSLLLAKLQKFDSDAAPLTMSVAATKKPVFEEKSESLETPAKTKILKVTTEKQTTTTKSTTTSVRRKSSTTEKKVQHTSDGKTVEQVEIRNCNEDNLKVSQVTTKKEESPELPNPVTTVKKRLIKKDTSKTTLEKNRKEEETVNDVNTVKTTKSLQDTDHKKLSLEETTKSTAGLVKQLSLAGSTTVTKKVEGKVTEETTPRKKSIKKSEATISSKVKETLDIGKDDAKRSLQRNCTTVITITPDTEEKVRSPTGMRKKSSICLSVPSNKSISRDSSEERKRVHFADVILNPTPLPSNGLQRMKSESSIPARVKISSKTEVKLTKDDGEIRKKKKLTSSKSTELPYVSKEEFRFEDLKQQLERRCSMEPLFSAGRRSPTSLISSSSVKDRLKKFENKSS